MSPTNILVLMVGPIGSAMSFTNIMNRIGRKTLPWGIPLETEHGFEFAIPMHTV